MSEQNDDFYKMANEWARNNKKEDGGGSKKTRLECLKMANLHATPQQIADGQVYKIADDYYDYIINGKK